MHVAEHPLRDGWIGNALYHSQLNKSATLPEGSLQKQALHSTSIWSGPAHGVHTQFQAGLSYVIWILIRTSFPWASVLTLPHRSYQTLIGLLDSQWTPSGLPITGSPLGVHWSFKLMSKNENCLHPWDLNPQPLIYSLYKHILRCSNHLS